MIKMFLATLFAYVVVSTPFYCASTGSASAKPRVCADLASYDERQFCWAVQKWEPERCRQISNDDLRRRCVAYFKDGGS